MHNLKIDEVKKIFGYGLVLLGIAPQVLFAVGKPEIAIPLQELYQKLMLGLPPGMVQGVSSIGGAALLHTALPPIQTKK